MSLDPLTSDQVKRIIRELASEGNPLLRPGIVESRLRELNRPIGNWNLRAEFSRLTDEGFLRFDADSAYWSLVED